MGPLLLANLLIFNVFAADLLCPQVDDAAVGNLLEIVNKQNGLCAHSVEMTIAGNENEATLNLNLSLTFDDIDKSAEEVLSMISEPARLNEMAEIVRDRAKGAAYQNTEKIGDHDQFQMKTQTWAKKMGVKLPLGSTKTICQRSKTETEVSLTCNSDQNDPETNTFLKSSTSKTSCSQVGVSVKCQYSIMIQPKKVTMYLQTMGANEVCFWSGIRAMRTTIGVAQTLLNSNSKAAYDAYANSPLEQKIQLMAVDYVPKAERQNFQFNEP
jgi:hypothetical protein